ncbi:MAG: DUF1611 domain-containing protein [Gammaproteobacteria bacterium]|nr:DUF1611 domain-containing protein [Gammaproteobacteria bacterium]
MSTRIYGSLARIADFKNSNFEVQKRDRSEWATGDYVEAEVVGTPTEFYRIEDRMGHMVKVEPGDWVVGALGDRAATLEGVGGWADIAADGIMHAMTSAGLMGFFTSYSTLHSDPLTLEYRGHLCRDDHKVSMCQFAMRADKHEFSVPTVLLFGTSMSAGKTTTGRRVCKELDRAGLHIIGTKLTGAGRYRDILSYLKTGASEIYDFVDGGLPSTAVPEKQFRDAIRPILNHVHRRKPDFVLVEAGASPLEPYNGSALIDELGDNIVCAILSASDPYAVVGVQKAFGLKPDLVTGPATTTSAAVELVKKLTGLPAINIIDPAAILPFRTFLFDKLGLDEASISQRDVPTAKAVANTQA